MLSWLITLQTLFHEINLFKYNHRRFGNIRFIPDLISEYFQPVYIFIERVTLTVTLFRSHLLISHFFHLLIIRHFVTDHWKSLNHWKIIIPNKYDETAVRSPASFGVHITSSVPFPVCGGRRRRLKLMIFHGSWNIQFIISSKRLKVQQLFWFQSKYFQWNYLFGSEKSLKTLSIYIIVTY